MPRKVDLAALPPIHGTWRAVSEWLTGFRPGADELMRAAAWSPVFSAQSFAPGRPELEDLWSSGGHVSWLGGPAAHPLSEWPRDVDGLPLAHVVTLCLADVAGASDEAGKIGWPDRREGLPTHGVLEVFHDLQTYGWEPADGARGGWLVRWVPAPERGGLAEPPSDLETPTELCQAGLLLPGFSLPCSLDLDAPAARGPEADAAFDVAEEVTEQVQRAWLLQQTGSAVGHPVPVTHVYGHSQNGARAVAEILDAVLPCGPGDSHRLVLDVESWTHLAGWFGDAEPLEVWMRDSDLAEQRFDAAWCLIRSD